jgi:5-methylcytosine-specific restriction endonuclease McrA
MKRSCLKSDPAKVAAFVQRGRENGREGMRSTALRRNTAGWPSARPPGGGPAVKIPPTIRAAAFARSNGLCIMCRHNGRRVRAQQAHHCYPKAKWPALAKVTANLVALCAACHAAHEGGSHRLPLAILPPETIALADGDGPMESYLARTYRA